ncbi:hypothetical protein [Mucilaginibacter sp. AK015]|uniref:hypothetical protein n=1 Tax=Mucilaginibacter sp. AK015 TaxID=2723072 RepID=UPI00160A1B1D|nr:hypothetical protein [Mucilaginibacter sp. AK015]MBB5395143.1 hypothetical protein [Mucilaginibacter sp. AK015]
MQPLKMLTNVQKARLLHSLLIHEIPDFLGYLHSLTETILNDQERIKSEWKDQLFGVDFWFELAGQVQMVMAKYPKDLCKSASVFADQLFDGYTAIFTVHALTQYVALAKYQDAKFKPAVELLFS